jgi:hypothetical protein
VPIPVAVDIVRADGLWQGGVGGYSDSPDKRYRMYGRRYEGFGSSKTIRITIVTNDNAEATLFSKQYPFHGDDIGWDASWDSHDNLKVVIYDYGEGVWFNGLKKDEPARRVFQTLSYHLDSINGLYHQEP